MRSDSTQVTKRQNCWWLFTIITEIRYW